MKHALLTLALFALLAGCGGGGSEIDTNQFRAPIDAYLTLQSMDIAISEFKDATLDDAAGTAKVTVSMQLKDPDMAGVKTTFFFDLAKEGDSWKVTGHKQK